MKTQNSIVWAYILGCIDSEAYGVTTTTDKEKLQFLADTFKTECVYPENLKRYGPLQNVMREWLMGLPSCFNVDFESSRILELAREWGSIPADMKNPYKLERLEDKILENWFNYIAGKTFQLFRKHSVSL